MLKVTLSIKRTFGNAFAYRKVSRSPLLERNLTGQKPTRTIFDMLFYFLFYLALLCIVIFICRVSYKFFSPFKISILSLSASSCLLLTWNFLLGPILMGETNSGVSAVLSSMISIALLTLFSMALCVLHYAFMRIVK